MTEIATRKDADPDGDGIDDDPLEYTFKLQAYNAKSVDGNATLEGLQFIWADCPRTVDEKEDIIEEYFNGNLVCEDINQYYLHPHAKLTGRY